jgi:hypothetical protein
LPIEGDTEEEMRNRVVAGSLLRAAGIRGCDCTEPCDCLQVEALWVHHERGITIQTSNGLVRLNVVFHDDQADKGQAPKETDVADETKQESPGVRIYLALEHIAKVLGSNAGDLHSDIMPIVREYDDGLEATWTLVNDGASKDKVLDALEVNIPAFRREKLPARK